MLLVKGLFHVTVIIVKYGYFGRLSGVAILNVYVYIFYSCLHDKLL